MKKLLTALTGVALLLTVSACGDADPAEAPETQVVVSEPAPAEPAPTTESIEAAEPAPTTESIEPSEIDPYSIMHNESDVAAHIGLDSNNYVTTPEGVECEAAVVLTTKSQVDMYADAGDAVATNPDGTAGVKNVSAEKATCQSFFEEKLSDFPTEN